MKIRQLLGHPEELEQEQPVPEFCLPRTKIGLEYEWESTQKFAPPEGMPDVRIAGVDRYFDAHVDNSLRTGGMEFTFRGGYKGSKLLNAVTAMDECSRALGFTGSYRTSLHVHMDMQDTNYPEDVALLGAVYCVVEPFLYQFVGNSRNTCNYCVPWYKHPQQFEKFLLAVRSNTPQTIVDSMKKGKGNKYSGLNFFSIGDFGTVEFRQAPVTMQKSKIIIWINLIMRLKEWTQHHQMTPDSFVDYCNRGANWILKDIFQSHYPDVVRLSRNVDVDFWEGTETLYQYVAI